MWEMAKFYQTSNGKTARRFLKSTANYPPLKHENVLKGITDAAERREGQVLSQLKASDVGLYYGTGAFVDPNTVTVQMNDGKTETIEADYFVIATGAQPRPHPTAKADGKVVFTSDDIMMQPFPKSVVIIGAGVIGCEFASIYANFNQTKVSIIEKSERILPSEDEDVAMFVQKLLEKKNVNFHHKSEMTANRIENGKFIYTLKDITTSETTEHVVDNALVSIGRVPNIGNLQLDKIGAKLDKGRLTRDEYMRVAPFKHIYACGDVATRVALVNVGEIEARSSIEHMYEPCPEDQVKVPLDNLSTIMFLDQEVAAVGMNEQACRKNNVAYKMARYGYEFVGRAIAMGNTRGFVKIIVTNDSKMQVLGVRAIGPHASSIIELASLAVHNKEAASNLIGMTTSYPTVSQGFQECLRMLLGNSVLKPNVFPQLILEEWTPPSFNRGRAYASGRK
ncbi:dihydrolipoamide dehydrogenase [Angomonas deanei]|nr:dihydrolipoamide dehydrogenase [Angomonas deanei]|eukprot:EPY43839.1 dihydrolipoamide dehydrogenase [Angomonas deanei]